MTNIRIGILGLQGDIEEHTAAASAAIADKRLRGVVTQVKTPSEIEEIDGLIISGGESTVIGSLLQHNKAAETVAARIRDGLPVLGTCAGLIVLSKKAYDRVVGETRQPLIGALDVVVERNFFGRQRESFEADLAIPKLGEKPFHGVFIRSPSIRQAGQGVEVLSKLNDVIVAVKQGNLIGTAFHPELTRDSRMHQLFIDAAQNYA